jgi:hypothetical protein
VLAAKSIAPESSSIINPTVEEYVPPVVPPSAKVTVAVPVAQYGELSYEIVAVGNAFTVTITGSITEQPVMEFVPFI